MNIIDHVHNWEGFGLIRELKAFNTTGPVLVCTIAHFVQY